MTYVDYYERALTNGVLSTKRVQEPRAMLHLLYLASGGVKARNYRGWGTLFESFWCGYGTWIEYFSKLGDSIYFMEENQQVFYIIQFISSTLNWKAGGVVINQKVETVFSPVQILKATFNFSTSKVANKLYVLNIWILL